MNLSGHEESKVLMGILMSKNVHQHEVSEGSASASESKYEENVDGF